MTKSLISTIAGLIGLIVFFVWQGIESKSLSNQRLREIYQLQWSLQKAEAEKDTIFVRGDYSVDTVWATKARVVSRETSGQVDTVYEDIPDIIADISIDTTARFETPYHKLSVNVKGKLHFPEEYAHRNWLLIVPDWQPPGLTTTPRSQRFALGVGLGFQVPSRASVAVLGRFNSWSLTGTRQVNAPVWGVGLNYEFVRF